MQTRQVSKGSRPARNKEVRVAFLIPGLQDRLIIRSKAERAVRPLVEKGVRVDVFVDVLAVGHEVGEAYDGGDRVRPSPEAPDAATIARVFRSAGAHGVQVNMTSQAEDIQMPAVQPKLWNRFHQFEPFANQSKSEVGRNIIRMMKVLERLAHRAGNVTQAEGRDYDLVLFDHDDSHWLAPIDVEWMLLRAAEGAHDRAVYTRGCKGAGALNDKTFVFSWPAAVAMLTPLFAEMYVPDERLNAMNPEFFWKHWAEVKGVESHGIPPRLLPTATSVYVAGLDMSVELCQKDAYLCEVFETDEYRPKRCGSLKSKN